MLLGLAVSKPLVMQKEDNEVSLNRSAVVNVSNKLGNFCSLIEIHSCPLQAWLRSLMKYRLPFLHVSLHFPRRSYR